MNQRGSSKVEVGLRPSRNPFADGEAGSIIASLVREKHHFVMLHAAQRISILSLEKQWKRESYRKWYDFWLPLMFKKWLLHNVKLYKTNLPKSGIAISYIASTHPTCYNQTQESSIAVERAGNSVGKSMRLISAKSGVQIPSCSCIAWQCSDGM